MEQTWKVEYRLGVQGSSDLGILSNSEFPSCVEAGKKKPGLSSGIKRGTTQRKVKALKHWLSVNKMSVTKNSGKVGLEAAIL